MNEPDEHPRFTLFSILTDDTLKVAIGEQQMKRLEAMRETYGELGKVPSSKTVRGFYVNQADLNERFSPSGQESDITVNQLVALG